MPPKHLSAMFRLLVRSISTALQSRASPLMNCFACIPAIGQKKSLLPESSLRNLATAFRTKFAPSTKPWPIASSAPALFPSNTAFLLLLYLQRPDLLAASVSGRRHKLARKPCCCYAQPFFGG